MLEKKTIYLVVGPTATNKSKFAIELAKKIDAEIISLDSMQIYKYLDIGTAKLKENQREGIKHYMIDVVEPDSEFSVFDYKNNTKKIIDDIFSRNKNVILCGGTGLYLQALLYDYSFSNFNKNEEFRINLEKKAKEFGNDYVYEILMKLDPYQAEKIHKNNLKRVIRAIEIAKFSNDNKTNQEDQKELRYNVVGYFLNTDREYLYKRINNRVDKMFEEGLFSEIKYLLNEKKLNFSMQSLSAIGYKEFKDYENKNLEDIKEEIKKNTRNYAKRQITWFKRYDFLEKIDIKKYYNIVE